MVGILPALLVGGCGVPREGVRPPDIILIVVDTLRADSILDPEGIVSTPNIDSLARDGISFSEASAQAPMTLPSHASMFSSRFPFEMGVLNNGEHVPEDLPLLSQWLQEQGYDTRAVISLGVLAGTKDDPGLRRGFDSYDQEVYFMEDAPRVLERVLDSLSRRDPSRPLFFFAHFCDPHEPYDAPGNSSVAAQVAIDAAPCLKYSLAESPPWRGEVTLEKGEHILEITSAVRFRIRHVQVGTDRDPLPLTWQEGKVMEYGRAMRIAFEVSSRSSQPLAVHLWMDDEIDVDETRSRYRQEVEFVDEHIGRILGDLKGVGLYDESLIIFTSDHGESLGEHGAFGHVEFLTEPMLRVPLIIKPPAGHPGWKRLAENAEKVVPLLDLTPTILEIAGLPPLPGQRGSSLLTRHDTVITAETHTPQAHWDLVGLRDERFKMIYIADREVYVMYDLVNDPQELEDVFSRCGQERAAWIDRLPALAAAAASHRDRGDMAVDAETNEMLRALGY
ncbi:MAG: sulfatase [Planctomycetota bacterium]